MGLLDEAIREHLELKRRHGANPEDVARAEREALGPAVRDRAAAAAGANVATDQPDPGLDDIAEPPEAPAFETAVGDPEPEPAVAESGLTPVIEPIDEVAPEEPAPAPPVDPAPAVPDDLGIPPPEDPPKPSEAQAPPPPVEEPPAEEPPAEEPPADQPTEIFDAGEIFAEDEPGAFPDQPPVPPAEDAAGDAPPPPEDGVEDVLEETPEFLQETPEHDRLWFEQKPPRDFDFDG